MVTAQVRDNAQNNRTIIKGTVEDSVVPYRPEFTIDPNRPQTSLQDLMLSMTRFDTEKY